MKSHDEMHKLEKELGLTQYGRNHIINLCHTIEREIHELDYIATFLQYQQEGEEKFDEQDFEESTLSAREEIKSCIGEIFSYAHLEEVEGNFDDVFKKKKAQKANCNPKKKNSK